MTEPLEAGRATDAECERAYEAWARWDPAAKRFTEMSQREAFKAGWKAGLIAMAKAFAADEAESHD